MMRLIPFDGDAITSFFSKHEICFDLASSTFSGQISCLSFQDFFTGADGLNPFAHDFLWVHNIRFFAASLRGRRHLQRVTAQYGKITPDTNYVGRVGDVIRAALGGILSGESRNG